MSEPMRSTPAGSEQRKATLLFVDDEQRVLSSMRAMFRRDYHVHSADSGKEALEILSREQVDVVISDQRMPEMTGVELLSAVKTRMPDTVRILLTGYADLEAVEASINESEVFRYLMKPCPSDELKQTVALAVEASRGGAAPGGAQLIPFPDRAAPGTPADGLAAAQPAQRTKSRQASAPARKARRNPPQAQNATEVLVLTRDPALFASIRAAVKGVYGVRQASSVELAVATLAEHPVGVLVSDTAVQEQDVIDLTQQLKVQVPELVSIIASDRSDAQSLIGLINNGQIYRFLLKPVARGQCRLWLESAVRKFNELQASSGALARHRVHAPAGAVGIVAALKSGLSRIRHRLNGG